MGACGSRDEQYKGGNNADDDDTQSKQLSPEQMRITKARDSFRFNNRTKESPQLDIDEDEESPKKLMHSRDSMVFNNRNGTNKVLELSLVNPEEFISGCRDVLRAPVLATRLRAAIKDGAALYSDVDMTCVAMIPQNSMFKFYSQECLRHAFFVTCDGPSDVEDEKAYEGKTVPASQILCLIRNMFFLKRMQVCFENGSLLNGVTKEKFAEACTQSGSVFAGSDTGALFDRVAADHAAAGGQVDWRHLVTAIADSFINSIALPRLE